jgi:hypothetical protein
MKLYRIALVVDFQLTVKPFSLSWPCYRIFLLLVVHFSPGFYGTDETKFPRKAERRLSKAPSLCGAPRTHWTGMSFAALQPCFPVTRKPVIQCTRMRGEDATLPLCNTVPTVSGQSRFQGVLRILFQTSVITGARFSKTPACSAYRDLTIRIPDYADLSGVSRKPPRRREPRLGQALPELPAGRNS